MINVTSSQQDTDEADHCDLEEFFELTLEEQEHAPLPVPPFPHQINPAVNYLPLCNYRDHSNALAYLICNNTMITRNNFLGTIPALGQETNKQISELIVLVNTMGQLLTSATHQIRDLKTKVKMLVTRLSNRYA